MIKVNSLYDEGQILIDEAFRLMDTQQEHYKIDFKTALEVIKLAYQRETLIGFSERLGHEYVLAKKDLNRNF